MNEFQAYPRATIQGFVVMLRFAKDGEAKPLLERGEKPRIFPTEKEALSECVTTLLRYMNGNYRCESMVAETPMQRADRAFKPIYRKGRKIEVERKESRA